MANIQNNLDNKTSAVMISRVYFQSGLINPHLRDIAKICREHGVPLVIDDYHGTNVVPLSIRDEGLEDTFILIGGYKYLQWGEANCFLRFPKDCTLRPVITGWLLHSTPSRRNKILVNRLNLTLGINVLQVAPMTQVLNLEQLKWYSFSKNKH